MGLGGLFCRPGVKVTKHVLRDINPVWKSTMVLMDVEPTDRIQFVVKDMGVISLTRKGEFLPRVIAQALPRLLGVAAWRGDPRSGESRAAAEHTARTREGPQRRQNYASLFFVVVPGAVWHRCCLLLFVYLLFVHACCMPGLWLDICFS